MHSAIAKSAIDATADRRISRTRSHSLSGHSTKTAVVTSRLAIADIAHLHHTAERTATTVSALIAQLVHEHARLLADGLEQEADHTLDDLDPVTERTAVSPNVARARAA